MDLFISGYCLIHERKVVVNDRLRFYKENFLTFADFIKSLYKQEQINYPKFYKMDALSKLGFLASELVLRERMTGDEQKEDWGIVLTNSSSSLDTDIVHQETITDRTNYFPSPSVFVYTLPNIVIGEVCIKHGIKGENAFLITETFDGKLLCDYVSDLMLTNRVKTCLFGWVEILGDNFEALIGLVENNAAMKGRTTNDFIIKPFTAEQLNIFLRNT